MTNGFLMNPMWYLATIPLIGLYLGSLVVLGGSIFVPIIFLTVLLSLLAYLSFNNIIGLFDAILLFMIIAISYIPFFLGPTSALFNIILIPLAIFLSSTSQK